MIAKVLQSMIDYFGQNRQNTSHALKVYGFARTIALSEGMDSEKCEILECAAILHDIGIPESIRLFGSDKGEYQEAMGRKVADELMSSLGFRRRFIDQVTFLIAHHHSYSVDGGLALQILLEADALVDLDEDNLRKRPREQLEGVFCTRTGQDLFCALYGQRPKALPLESASSFQKAMHS